ncbi:Flp family type IVb pilin [Mitsuokella sp. WILCCON 0060]|uniref:Flp family type IVb pilin n=1 Tax=unclassified Mitsuokella TaxID=2637239 RepID=UPI003F0782B6
MTYQKQKAQGIVEYALILAFIVGVAVALFNSNGLANAIGEAFFNVSEAIQEAASNSTKQERVQNRLADALENAIRGGVIQLGDNQWIEIDVQQDPNKQSGNGYNVDGGASPSAYKNKALLSINGNAYTSFQNLWNATELKMYEMNMGEESGWTGVRIVSNGNGTYTTHYYSGDATTVKNQPNINYKDTGSMDTATRTDGKSLLQNSVTWTK